MPTLPSNYDNLPLTQLLSELTVERFRPTGRYTKAIKPVDDDLEIARRRRILNDALDPVESRGLHRIGGAA